MRMHTSSTVARLTPYGSAVRDSAVRTVLSASRRRFGTSNVFRRPFTTESVSNSMNAKRSGFNWFFHASKSALGDASHILWASLTLALGIQSYRQKLYYVDRESLLQRRTRVALINDQTLDEIVGVVDSIERTRSALPFDLKQQSKRVELREVIEKVLSTVPDPEKQTEFELGVMEKELERPALKRTKSRLIVSRKDDNKKQPKTTTDDERRLV